LSLLGAVSCLVEDAGNPHDAEQRRGVFATRLMGNVLSATAAHATTLEASEAWAFALHCLTEPHGEATEGFHEALCVTDDVARSVGHNGLLAGNASVGHILQRFSRQ
jgi:hypothetical protein